MALKGGSNQSYWVRCSSASKHHATFFFDNKSLHRKYKYSIPSYQIIQYAALRTQFAVTFVDRKMIMHPRLAHYNTFYCSAWWGHIATSSSQKQILHCTCLVGPQTYQILSRKTIGPFLLFNNSIPLAASCTHTKNGRVLCISSHD